MALASAQASSECPTVAASRLRSLTSHINNGGVVASKDPASPTTNVVAGNTNQVLAKFDVLASGDSIKFTEMDFDVTRESLQHDQ